MPEACIDVLARTQSDLSAASFPSSLSQGREPHLFQCVSPLGTTQT